MNIQNYWTDVLSQDAEAMRSYFCENARINWHNTNEQFTVAEFICANCEYPKKWDGEIERLIKVDDLIISVVRVYPIDQSQSFHVTSFITLSDEKIIAIDEYWGDDGLPPQWRIQLKLGTQIK